MGKTAFRAEFRRSARHCADRRRHFTAIEAATVKKKKEIEKEKKPLEHRRWNTFHDSILCCRLLSFLCRCW